MVDGQNSLNEPRRPTLIPDWTDWARLLSFIFIVFGGWLLVYKLLPTPDAIRPELLKEAKETFSGITPAVGACYAYGTNAAAVIISVAVGTTLGASYIFGTFLYKLFRISSANERESFLGCCTEANRRQIGRFARNNI